MKNKEPVQKSLFLYGATLALLIAFTGCIMPPLPTTATPAVTAPRSTMSAVEQTAGAVAVNGITLAYERFGSPTDETILLIAGTGMQLAERASA